MKFRVLSVTPLLFPFLISASEKPLNEMLSGCLKLGDNIKIPFADTSSGQGVGNGVITGTDNTRVYFYDYGDEFRAICSNEAFDIENEKLKGTKEEQQYIFIWSSEHGLINSRLTMENIEYSIEHPRNINKWLKRLL